MIHIYWSADPYMHFCAKCVMWNNGHLTGQLFVVLLEYRVLYNVYLRSYLYPAFGVTSVQNLGSLPHLQPQPGLEEDAEGQGRKQGSVPLQASNGAFALTKEVEKEKSLVAHTQKRACMGSCYPFGFFSFFFLPACSQSSLQTETALLSLFFTTFSPLFLY